MHTAQHAYYTLRFGFAALIALPFPGDLLFLERCPDLAIFLLCKLKQIWPIKSCVKKLRDCCHCFLCIFVHTGLKKPALGASSTCTLFGPSRHRNGFLFALSNRVDVEDISVAESAKLQGVQANQVTPLGSHHRHIRRLPDEGRVLPDALPNELR